MPVVMRALHNEACRRSSLIQKVRIRNIKAKLFVYSPDMTKKVTAVNASMSVERGPLHFAFVPVKKTTTAVNPMIPVVTSREVKETA